MGEYFGMKVNFSRFKNYFCVITVGILMSSMSAFADESIISSVVISKAKDKQNAYELNIDSTKPVEYKQNNDDDSMVWFDLKDSVLAEDVGTVYDDVVNIDNIVVKQIDKRKVRIYVKGNNVKNTELVFINSLFDTKEKPKKIIINRPINEYKSIEDEQNDSDLESQDDIQEWDNNSFNFSHLMKEAFTTAKKEMAGIGMLLLIGFLIMVLVIKNITKKIFQDSEPLIGLNHAKENDMANIYSKEERKPVAKQIKTKDIDFDSIANKTRLIKQAQEQLAVAHNKYQEYLKNKYKNGAPQKATSDIITKGIALNQYKKSNVNPYLDQPVIKMNQSDLSTPTGNFQIPPRPKREINTPRNTSPYIQKRDSRIDNPIQNVENKTSLKFLESVTKIYEQTGREDLAIGLKNSISKTKQKI